MLLTFAKLYVFRKEVRPIRILFSHSSILHILQKCNKMHSSIFVNFPFYLERSDVLLHVPLKFITHEDCSRIWASFNYVQDDNVCAGDNQINASACQVSNKILSLLGRHINM